MGPHTKTDASYPNSFLSEDTFLTKNKRLSFLKYFENKKQI